MQAHQNDGANDAKKTNNGSNFVLEHILNLPLFHLERMDSVLLSACSSCMEITQKHSNKAPRYFTSR